MASTQDQVPYSDSVTDQTGKLSRPWEQFFRRIQDVISYIKGEESFALVNNQSVAADLVPMTFDRNYVSHAVIEYVIQRTTNSAEALESGVITVAYLPNSNTWNINKTASITVGTPGVTLTITSDGQVRYTTTNQSGTLKLSRIVYRAREIKAKSNLYSRLG